MAEHEAGCQKVATLLAVLAEDGGLTEESATTEDICETSVQAIYPQKGWEVYRHLNNMLLQPQSQHTQVSCFHIMWTTNRQDLPEAH